jgi:hypothetical protein
MTEAFPRQICSTNQLPLRLHAPLLRLRTIRLKLPCWDMLHEHLVNLLVAPSARLRVAEVKVHSTEDRQRAEDEGRFRAQVGLVGVEAVSRPSAHVLI